MPIVTSARVRLAEPADVPELLEICRENHAENGMFSLSDARLNEMLDRHFKKQGATIGMIGKPGKCEASICLLISNMWFTEDFHLEDVWIYVRPQYRAAKLRNLENLIEFAKRCSDEIGLPVFSGIMSSIQTEAKIRIFRRLMGDPCGAFFGHWPKAQKLAKAG